jgi:hypothetical protein
MTPTNELSLVQGASRGNTRKSAPIELPISRTIVGKSVKLNRLSSSVLIAFRIVWQKFGLL